jgi:hypothetical protein
LGRHRGAEQTTRALRPAGRELLQPLAAEPAGRPIVLDLKDLLLVDREAVRFLHRCEGKGIVLRNCPPYVRGWMVCGEEQR